MIRINLFGEKIDYSGAIAMHSIGAVITLIAALGICFVLHTGIGEQLASLEKEQTDLKRELRLLRKKTKRVNDLEEKKVLLKEKLSTIALLKAKKQGPVKVLDNLNNAIPERAWLERVKERGGMIEIHGVAVDNQTIAMFMGTLERSPYFDELRLMHSRHVTIDEVPVKEFMLRGSLISALDLMTQAGDAASADEAKDDKKLPEA